MQPAAVQSRPHHAPDPLPERLALQVFSPWRRVLVAGVGDALGGDAGFGGEVVRRLMLRPLPPGVEVLDFASRGLDLVYALRQGYQAALLVDTARRGEAPGTLTVIEPHFGRDGEGRDEEVPLDPSDLDPVQLVRFAHLFGRVPRQVMVLVCEPQDAPPAPLDPTMPARMSPPVAEAVEHAVPLLESLLADVLASGSEKAPLAATSPAV
jgi:hydrogenase maturation protease